MCMWVILYPGMLRAGADGRAEPEPFDDRVFTAMRPRLQFPEAATKRLASLRVMSCDSLYFEGAGLSRTVPQGSTF